MGMSIYCISIYIIMAVIVTHCVLSLKVVGPPGTGKTDVAVQIISNVYHNFPEQRTLIVTHSNQVNPTHRNAVTKMKDRENVS